MSKRALITGITGQDGSYLAEFLLARDYEVHGLVRRIALHDPERHLSRLVHIRDHLVLHAGALESSASLHQVVDLLRPDECYHLAGHSFVNTSFEDDLPTLGADINGTHYLLAALNLGFASSGPFLRRKIDLESQKALENKARRKHPCSLRCKRFNPRRAPKRCAEIRLEASAEMDTDAATASAVRTRAGFTLGVLTRV